MAAKELERELKCTEAGGGIVGDIALIRGEVDHCREILGRMSTDAGSLAGEAMCVVTAQQLIEHLLLEGGRVARVQVRLDQEARQQSVSIPLSATTQALRGLVQNAADAGGQHPIELRVEKHSSNLRLTLVDRGKGMSAEVLARAGEPFFTTKEPGKGMGLGLFLARSLVERLDGTLRIQSIPNQGTAVVVELPLVDPLGSVNRS